MSRNPQFIVQNGRLVKNPDYQESATKKPTTVVNPNALTVVSTPADLMAAQNATNVPMPSAVEGMIVGMQNPAYANAFGSDEVRADEVLDGLSNIFAQNEIPIGLMSKLIALKDFTLDFMVDNSTSMGSWSPMKRQEASVYMQNVGNMRNVMLTRWEEAEDRLHVLIDIIAFVPTGPITLSFFNEANVLVLERQGKTPTQFALDAHQQIRQAFSRNPYLNHTPILQNMQTMLTRNTKNTMHYVLTDGEPSGGASEIRDIKNFLLTARGRNSQTHPFTFLACSNREEDVMWMREVEDIAPYVAAQDDFTGERREVYFDQGCAFPYSRGFWWLCNLVAALNPDDLDALDQHAPLTKQTLDNLLGRVHSETEYRYYFDNHPHARQLFGPDYDLFVQKDFARNIESVQCFRAAFANQLSADINRGDDESEAQAERIAANTVMSRFGGYRSFTPVVRGALPVGSGNAVSVATNPQAMWNSAPYANYGTTSNQPSSQGCPCVAM